jgi:hypothetical protein
MTNTEPGTTSQDGMELPEEYAIVEIYGHRRFAGRVFEVEKFGGKMMRIDVPTNGDFAVGFVTQFYGCNAVFSLTPCDLATVQRANLKPTPPALYHRRDEDDDDFGGDDQ